MCGMWGKQSELIKLLYTVSFVDLNNEGSENVFQLH